MALIYFGLDSEQLESLSDEQINDVFNNLNRYGKNLMKSFLDKQPDDNRLKKIYYANDETVTVRSWMKAGFSPVKYSDDFNIDQLKKSDKNPILEDSRLSLLFEKDTQIDRFIVNDAIKELILNRIDFYKGHYKESSELSYWRNL